MSPMHLIFYQLPDEHQHDDSVMLIVSQLGRHLQLYRGCVLVACEVAAGEVAERIAMASRGGGHLVVVEADKAVIRGLTEDQRGQLNALYAEAGPKLSVSKLKGAVPAPERPVTIGEMNEAIEELGGRGDA